MALQNTGAISVEDVAVEFGGTAPHSLSEYYGAGGAPGSGALALSDFYGLTSAILAPVGLIVPYTSATAPTNWTRFTSADGRMIVGAGSSYSVGTTGGNSTVAVSAATSNTGGHTGPTQAVGGIDNCYSGIMTTPNGVTAGAHSHNFSGNIASVVPPYKNFTLMKCTTSSKIPAGAIMLATSSISNLSNVETSTDRILMAASSYGGTGGSNSVNGSITTSNTGSHRHVNTLKASNSNIANSTRESNNSGAHSHSASVSISLNQQRFYLSAWTNASADFGIEDGVIAMWEGATAPSGWTLCTGASGTPDLRNRFIHIGTTGNHGTSAGSHNMSWNASASNTVNHNHTVNASGYGNTPGATYHGSYSWTHTHNASGSGSFIPPYYALTFIKYTG